MKSVLVEMLFLLVGTTLWASDRASEGAGVPLRILDSADYSMRSQWHLCGTAFEFPKTTEEVIKIPGIGYLFGSLPVAGSKDSTVIDALLWEQLARYAAHSHRVGYSVARSDSLLYKDAHTFVSWPSIWLLDQEKNLVDEFYRPLANANKHVGAAEHMRLNEIILWVSALKAFQWYLKDPSNSILLQSAEDSAKALSDMANSFFSDIEVYRRSSGMLIGFGKRWRAYTAQEFANIPESALAHLPQSLRPENWKGPLYLPDIASLSRFTIRRSADPWRLPSEKLTGQDFLQKDFFLGADQLSPAGKYVAGQEFDAAVEFSRTARNPDLPEGPYALLENWSVRNLFLAQRLTGWTDPSRVLVAGVSLPSNMDRWKQWGLQLLSDRKFENFGEAAPFKVIGSRLVEFMAHHETTSIERARALQQKAQRLPASRMKSTTALVAPKANAPKPDAVAADAPVVARILFAPPDRYPVDFTVYGATTTNDGTRKPSYATMKTSLLQGEDARYSIEHFEIEKPLAPAGLGLDVAILVLKLKLEWAKPNGLQPTVYEQVVIREPILLSAGAIETKTSVSLGTLRITEGYLKGEPNAAKSSNVTSMQVRFVRGQPSEVSIVTAERQDEEAFGEPAGGSVGTWRDFSFGFASRDQIIPLFMLEESVWQRVRSDYSSVSVYSKYTGRARPNSSAEVSETYRPDPLDRDAQMLHYGLNFETWTGVPAVGVFGSRSFFYGAGRSVWAQLLSSYPVDQVAPTLRFADQFFLQQKPWRERLQRHLLPMP